jgi:dethiobiotin synthetase
VNLAPIPRGCFVTGTDTGVGKTCVSAALLHIVRRQRLVAAGFKPVAAGTEMVNEDRFNDDVRVLCAAGSTGFSEREVGPLQLDTPCAPHIAAALQGVVIERDALIRSARALQERVDVLVVEGVGGLVVPLGPTWDTSHLACALGLPVVLVVGMRLGCLNHALLTAEAIRARSLRLAGWVGNVIDPEMPYLAENVVTLRHEMSRRHGAPCLGVVPALDPPTPEQVTEHLDTDALMSALALQSLPRRHTLRA